MKTLTMLLVLKIHVSLATGQVFNLSYEERNLKIDLESGFIRSETMMKIVNTD